MDEKITGILVGVVITVGIIQIIGTVIAHGQNGNDLNEDINHHSHHMMGMHDDMEKMECMSLPLEEMDKDSDGLCDICGMSVEHCAEMKTMDCHN